MTYPVNPENQESHRNLFAEKQQWKQRAEAAEALVREKDARIAELSSALSDCEKSMTEAALAEQGKVKPSGWAAAKYSRALQSARAALSAPSPTYELERAVVEAAKFWRKRFCVPDAQAAVLEADLDKALDALAKARKTADDR